MINILNYINGKRKKSSSGWTSFNAPCCIHNGESPDKRMRGGVMFTNDTDWSYHCFNCGYKASFSLGRAVSFKAKKLLTWMGVPEMEIQRLSLESLKHKDVAQILEDRKEEAERVYFLEQQLPATARLITEADTQQYEYLRNRRVDNYPFMIDTAQKRPGILVPYTYENKIVGNTTRFLDDRKPKYLNDQQQGYVLGVDWQHPDWQFAILTEGVFDALSISGLAAMHNTLNDKQAAVLRRLNREIVVVPDQDSAGLKLIDAAIKYGLSVSIPEWEADVKDINDAVVRYGKLHTLINIIKHKNSSSVKIKLARKQLARTVND